MRHWKFKLGVVLVFLLGLVIGGLGTGWWFAQGYHGFRGPPRKVEAAIMNKLSWYLHLSDEQKERLEPIVRDVSRKLEAIRQQVEPEMRRAVEEGMERAKPILNAEQYEKLEHRYRELRRKWERRHERD